MNMDIDPRYMPKGQYREARNVRVIDTDNENSGVIESMDGTRVVIDEPLFTAGSVTAGMYEYNNKIYLFTALKQGGFLYWNTIPLPAREATSSLTSYPPCGRKTVYATRYVSFTTRRTINRCSRKPTIKVSGGTCRPRKRSRT